MVKYVFVQNFWALHLPFYVICPQGKAQHMWFSSCRVGVGSCVQAQLTWPQRLNDLVV